MKIFGVALNQTGTTTLGVCPRYWGFRHISIDETSLSMREKTNTKALLARASRSQSFEDWPWALYYRELDQALPDSRLIQTRRCAPDAWFKSLCAHADRTGATRFRELVYDHAMPHPNRDERIRFYECHLQAVRNYFCKHLYSLLKVYGIDGNEWRTIANLSGTTT
jgi:Sulfotransferase domain